jgi:hypothetical protein
MIVVDSFPIQKFYILSRSILISMEIVGKYKVRIVKDEKLIKVPDEAFGEYLLKVHPDGSFSFHPTEEQNLILGNRFVVKDPKNIIDPTSFKDEKKASDWKEKMERQTGRIFRMEKIFKSNGIGFLE